MNASVEVDASEFLRALDLAIQHSSRETADVINHACLDVIIQAARDMPKADPEKITTQLTSASFTVATSKTGKTLKKPKVFYHGNELVYKIVNAKRRKQGLPGISGQKMHDEAQKLIKRRRASCGYTAYAGWQNACKAFGGRGFGSKSDPQNSKAKDGFGRKASEHDMVAEMVNTAQKALEIGGEAFQAVLDRKAEEMIHHVEQKLGERLKTL